MYHLRKFATNDEYRQYLEDDDQWRPLVAYVVNEHPEDISTGWGGKDKNMQMDDWSSVPETSVLRPDVSIHSLLPAGGDDKRWVDYHDLGEHWIEIFNNGTMYFHTQYDASGNVLFDASVDEKGNLYVLTPESSVLAPPYGYKSWFQYDENGQLNFWNYPVDYLD